MTSLSLQNVRRFLETRSPKDVAVAAGGWLVILTVLDAIVTGTTVVLAVLFAISPLIAAAALRARTTALFGAAAIVDTALSPLWDGWQGGQKYAVRMVDVVLICLGSVLAAGVREHREQRLTRVTAIAHAAQQAMLPALPSSFGPLELGVRYRSASAEALIGGDLFDAIALDDEVRLIVGDVRGKGLEAVGHAARTIRAFRQYGASSPDLATVASRMSGYLAPFFGSEDFVTASLVEVTHTGVVTVVGCGHPPPLVGDAGGFRLLDVANSPPLGLSEQLGLTPAYEAKSFVAAKSDRLLLYTDGLIEARDLDGQFLPVEDIGPCLSGSDLEDALDGLLSRLAEHVAPAGLTDDLALVLIEFVGGPDEDGLRPAHLRSAFSSRLAQSWAGTPRRQIRPPRHRWRPTRKREARDSAAVALYRGGR